MYKKNCKCFNQKLIYKYPCQPIVVKGGPTGPTGPTGPAGQNIEVRSTTTLPETGFADVTSTKVGSTTYLDFFIPRGQTGFAETILVGNVTKGQPDELPEIADRFVDNVHFLDFKIPQGEQGPKGEQGPAGDTGISEQIMVDQTETLNPGEDALVKDNFENNIHHLTFYIPKGEKGDTGEDGETGPAGEQGQTGPQGIAGPPGLTPDINATIYNSKQQIIKNGTDIVIDELETNNGMRLQGTTGVVAITAGTYLISFSINNSQDVSAGDSVGIAINNVLVASSKRPITVSTNTTATIVKKLAKNDVITLLPTLTQDRTITASGAPSAMLTAILIAV